LLDALTKIEVAQIGAGVDTNSEQISTALQAGLGQAQMANEHALQARQHAHERQMQAEAPQPAAA
jgi:hypothetical protein